jgi:hypothetical protein
MNVRENIEKRMKESEGVGRKYTRTDTRTATEPKSIESVGENEREREKCQ